MVGGTLGLCKSGMVCRYDMVGLVYIKNKIVLNYLFSLIYFHILKILYCMTLYTI